jgi:imidazolonepropionase-like amidohydrolase
VIALTHVRVIDGTGGPGKADQTLVVQNGRIAAVTAGVDAVVPPEAVILDLAGHSVFPGLVGMHDHLFYQIERPSGTIAYAPQAAFAKLYLASGVTTIRTGGSLDFDGDRRIKKLVDEGREPGPKIHLTGPFLVGLGDPDPERIAREVAAQADAGATSFKAYTTLRAAELKAAIQAAHERGLRITGHLCAVGFREAAALGIDNLEHGLIADTEFYSNKQPDVCPPQGEVLGELLYMNTSGAAVQRTIRELVGRGVSVTSTLAVIETFTGRDSIPDPRVPDMLASRLHGPFHEAREVWSDHESSRAQMWVKVLRKEMEFERQFVAAGGRLIAGADPTGWGGTMAGFADLRGLELQDEAGLTPEQAIKVATSNGAQFLYESKSIGTIEAGKQADLVVVRGDPSANIADVQKVELVFKDGVGYDPAALIAAATGSVGRFEARSIVRWPFNVLLGGLLLLFVVRGVWRRRAT